MLLAGVLIVVAASMFIVFSGPLARRNVASQNAFWGTRWSERAVKRTRAASIAVSVLVLGYGLVLIAQSA